MSVCGNTDTNRTTSMAILSKYVYRIKNWLNSSEFSTSGDPDVIQSSTKDKLYHNYGFVCEKNERRPGRRS
jgi:hypothetical protein